MSTSGFAQASNQEGRILLAIQAYKAHQVSSLRKASALYSVPPVTDRHPYTPFHIGSQGNGSHPRARDLWAFALFACFDPFCLQNRGRMPWTGACQLAYNS
jgi:hypothetical protein